MDAVYLCMTIGIGLAAGVQLLSVAYIASLAFVVVVLGLWRSGYGAKAAYVEGWTMKERPAKKKPVRIIDVGGDEKEDR